MRLFIFVWFLLFWVFQGLQIKKWPEIQLVKKVIFWKISLQIQSEIKMSNVDLLRTLEE